MIATKPRAGFLLHYPPFNVFQMRKWEWREMRSLLLARLSIAVAVATAPLPALAQIVGSGIDTGALETNPACQPDCDALQPDSGEISGQLDQLARSRYRTGLRQLDRGEYRRAARAFSLALRRDPDNSLYQFMTGGALYLDGDFKEARPYLKQAVEPETTLKDEQVEIAQKMLKNMSAD